MAKFIKRSIAMLLVLNMLTGMIPAQALAADGDSGVKATVVVKSKSSSKSKSSKSKSSKSSSSKKSSSKKSSSKKTAEKLTASAGEPAPSSVEEPKLDSQLTTGEGIDKVEQPVEESTKVDANGNIITTESQTTTTNGTLEDGSIIEGEETYTETTKTDSEGNVLQNEATLEGQETITSENQEITPDDTDLPKVNVTISPDLMETGGVFVTDKDGSEYKVEKLENGTRVVVKVTGTDREVLGDETSGNFEELVTTIYRKVTATISDVEITTEHHANTGLAGLEPHKFKEPDYSGYYHKHVETVDGKEIVHWYPVVNRTQEEYDILPQSVKDLYELGDDGNYKPTSGTPFVDIDNEVRWDSVISGVIGSSTGAPQSIKENGSTTAHTPYLIVLHNKAGEAMSSYCLDVKVSTGTTYKYIFENLADANYFEGDPEDQEEAKEHVRAIALSGYWGTESGTGSLEFLKDNMTEALNDENFKDVITYQDADGNSHSLDPSNPVDRETLKGVVATITDDDAIAAMQGAFWAYGRSKGYVNGIGAYYGSEEVDLRLELIRSFLISDYLKDKIAADEENQETTIIDKDAFLTKDGITLSVGDKVQMVEDVTEDDGSDNSADNGSDNGGKKKDVYEVDITFAMVVEPDPVTDDLVVSLIDASGNTVRKARLAGDDSKDDESFTGITKGENGNYTFEDLHLAEGTDFTFDLNLEGVQYLEQGVYIYKSTAGYDGAQTLVGVAEGEHNVDVSSRFTVNFEVTESKKVVATRKWHKTTDPVNKPGNTPPPARYRLTQGVGQLEIIDEEVPLAEPPQTGDISMLWFAMIMMSGLGLCMLNLLEKKREEA